MEFIDNQAYRCLHKKQAVDLCLNAQCNGRLCQQCIKDQHNNHMISYLNINDKASLIYNLRINQFANITQPYARANIKNYSHRIFQKLNQLFEVTFKIKQRMMSNIQTISQAICQSFTNTAAITKKKLKYVKLQKQNIQRIPTKFNYLTGLKTLLMFNNINKMQNLSKLTQLTQLSQGGIKLRKLRTYKPSQNSLNQDQIIAKSRNENFGNQSNQHNYGQVIALKARIKTVYGPNI